jgi:uroporphyrinogen-III synthase
VRVLITRPASDAPVWVAALKNAGYDAQAMALIDIAPVPDVKPMDQAPSNLWVVKGV